MLSPPIQKIVRTPETNLNRVILSPLAEECSISEQVDSNISLKFNDVSFDVNQENISEVNFDDISDVELRNIESDLSSYPTDSSPFSPSRQHKTTKKEKSQIIQSNFDSFARPSPISIHNKKRFPDNLLDGSTLKLKVSKISKKGENSSLELKKRSKRVQSEERSPRRRSSFASTECIASQRSSVTSKEKRGHKSSMVQPENISKRTRTPKVHKETVKRRPNLRQKVRALLSTKKPSVSSNLTKSYISKQSQQLKIKHSQKTGKNSEKAPNVRTRNSKYSSKDSSKQRKVNVAKYIHSQNSSNVSKQSLNTVSRVSETESPEKIHIETLNIPKKRASNAHSVLVKETEEVSKITQDKSTTKHKNLSSRRTRAKNQHISKQLEVFESPSKNSDFINSDQNKIKRKSRVRKDRSILSKMSSSRDVRTIAQKSNDNENRDPMSKQHSDEGDELHPSSSPIEENEAFESDELAISSRNRKTRKKREDPAEKERRLIWEEKAIHEIEEAKLFFKELDETDLIFEEVGSDYDD